MGLSKRKIEGIRMAGSVHDIGKIQIPTEILIKPEHLSDIEFVMIKMHPQVGYDILKNIEFPYPVARIILQHHERIDGSGYPEGLSGNKILLETKILAVADVIEAMSAHRPYRPSLGVPSALEEVEKYKGRLYEPEVVDACFRLFHEKKIKF
jgi:HD-GYP domain-containing protein (c-di-GMP phosphodiesterase class II)